MVTLLAQLTDLHVRAPGSLAYGRLDTAQHVSAAVDAISGLRQKPDAVVVTGDLTDSGDVSEYRHLAELLKPLDVPYFLLTGNHDNREHMRRCFPAHTYMGVEGFIQYSVRVGSVRMIGLDSSACGRSGGELCSVRLAWLRDELERDRAVPTVIAIHHPPFQTLIGHMDKIGLLTGAEEFEGLVRSNSNVIRVICGHLHRTIYTTFAGTIASVAPSTAHQVCLDLCEEAVPAWSLEPPGLHVHAWVGDGVSRLVTHVVPIGRFGGPYLFSERHDPRDERKRPQSLPHR